MNLTSVSASQCRQFTAHGCSVNAKIVVCGICGDVEMVSGWWCSIALSHIMWPRSYISETDSHSFFDVLSSQFKLFYYSHHRAKPILSVKIVYFWNWSGELKLRYLSPNRTALSSWTNNLLICRLCSAYPQFIIDRFWLILIDIGSVRFYFSLLRIKILYFARIFNKLCFLSNKIHYLLQIFLFYVQ